jgi:hypothetical protein
MTVRELDDYQREALRTAGDANATGWLFEKLLGLPEEVGEVLGKIKKAEFHGRQNIPHCSLYDAGFNRLGCIGCPLSSNQAKEFERWPKYEKMWRRAFDQFWDRWHGVPTLKGKRRWFEDKGSAQGLWAWWRSGVGQGDGPACQGAELLATHELGDENANDE